MADCRKCSGSGHFIVNGEVRGECYECNGTGKVDDVAYQTTPAKASSHPSMREQPEWEYDGRPLTQYPTRDCQCSLCRKYASWKAAEFEKHAARSVVDEQ